MIDEKTPLLEQDTSANTPATESTTHPSFPRRFASSVSATFRYIISTILAPGRYVITCFYDEQGHFSAALPFYTIGQKLSRRQRKKSSPHGSSGEKNVNQRKKHSGKKTMMTASSASASSEAPAVFTDSDVESEKTLIASQDEDSPAHHTRSKASTDSNSDTMDSSRRATIRIKAADSDPRANRKGTGASGQTSLSVANLKSPTSPTSSLRLTKYPRAPVPPRPLIPRRHPSYTNIQPQSINRNLKTLIIDLDETLIHSMAKGGRMSTGHMVEVKLQTPVGAGGAVIGPQVPILYYVHKRPHCDEFLRKVSKWYNLIVFTASVQEYADPVIDWLELERKYFSARYYRQHCTYRNGAYIKDLSQVEPDLSRVMILDNSPISYIFHEDNAIPIEGWISDPTDNDLLHLIPTLEGLQHTTDVRALLALRLGEATNATNA